VGALGTYRLNFASSIDKQNLCAVDTLDVNFPLLAGLERQCGDVLELVLGHVTELGDEQSRGDGREILFDKDVGKCRAGQNSSHGMHEDGKERDAEPSTHTDTNIRMIQRAREELQANQSALRGSNPLPKCSTQ
jgi:hypothetical protein